MPRPMAKKIMTAVMVVQGSPTKREIPKPIPLASKTESIAVIAMYYLNKAGIEKSEIRNHNSYFDVHNCRLTQ